MHPCCRCDSHRDRERGSGAVFAIFAAMIVLTLAALVIDGGTALSMREQAAGIAAEAARKVAGNLDQAALRDGVIQIDADSCTTLADEVTADYGAGAVTGCTVDGRDVTVTVQITYRPLLLGMLDPHLTLTASGTATVHLAAGITTGN
jgi:Flp pilus assembly protein TadG